LPEASPEIKIPPPNGIVYTPIEFREWREMRERERRDRDRGKESERGELWYIPASNGVERKGPWKRKIAAKRTTPRPNAVSSPLNCEVQNMLALNMLN
jgi:hypothetical protein